MLPRCIAFGCAGLLTSDARPLSPAGRLAGLEPELAELEARPPLAAALARLVRVVVATNQGRARLHRTLFAEGPLDPELMRMLLALRGETCARVARYLAASPEAHAADPALAARLAFDALMALAHGFALDASAGGSPTAREAEIVRMLTAWLTAR